MSENKFINAFVDRIDKNSKTVIAVYGCKNSNTDETEYNEVFLSLNDFSNTPQEGDSLVIYADSKKLVVINIGKKVFCEVEYLIMGGENTVYKKEFKEECNLSGIFEDRNDEIKLIKARKKFWKKCLKEKSYLEEDNKNCEIFIKKSTYWTDKFEFKKIFSDYIKNIGFTEGQNTSLNSSDPDVVPNSF